MQKDALTAAAIQLTSGPDIQDNLDRSAALIREAAAQGARLIATPENTDQMRRRTEDKLNTAGGPDDHPAIAFYAALAKELGVWLLIGSIGIKISETQLANRQHLFAPDGSLSATYDKIHMFDVKLSRSEFYNESKDNRAGSHAVIADLDDLKLGMSICYDVRFAALYRTLAQNGAHILSVPAAFTVPTGQAHWEVLLRARAIETGSYVIAPAQIGEHEGGRKTYGHSLIIGPWGDILAENSGGPGIIYAEIDRNKVEDARAAIPALRHDREFTLKS